MASDQSDRTDRFEAKRELIISAAAELINERGVKGMTFVDVGRMVDLNTTSIAYYFKRKEKLAEAAFHRTLARIEREVDEAAAKDSPRARIAHYLELTFDRIAQQRAGTYPPEAALSDIRAMPDDTRERLLGEFVGMFRKARGFFGSSDDPVGHADLTARTHIFLEFTYWLPVLLSDYSRTDFVRVRERCFQLIEQGIAAPGHDVSPMDLPQPAEAEGEGAWRMPLGQAYDDQLKSRIADMKNIGGRPAGSITAAQFLKRFVKDDMPWIHLDIAGVASVKTDTTLAPKGATGWGVAALDRLVRDRFEGGK